VRALLSVTFDTVREADDFAIKMAKTWIQDRYYPLIPASSLARATHERVS